MISLFRIALIMLIIYLVQRAFSMKNSTGEGHGKNVKINPSPQNKRSKVSKELGEYVDYEEVKKKA
jgi:hypothetical protein